MQNIFKIIQYIQINDGSLFFLFVLTLVFLLSLFLKGFFSSLVLSLLHKIFAKSSLKVDASDLKPARKSLHIIFVFSMLYLAAIILSNTVGQDSQNYRLLLTVTRQVYRIAMITAVSIMAYSLIPSFLKIQKKIGKKDHLTENPIVDLFIERFLRILVVCICFLSILSEIGINVNGLITGLGLGGLIFALAAQDTAANLFAGLVIVSDKPFLVGDWIATDELEGVVEDISFRSTRIRTFDDALTVVPNSKLSAVAITNWTKMTKRRVNFKITLDYAVEEETLNKITEQIRQSLLEQEQILSDSIIVRLDELSPLGIGIRIIFYAKATSLAELKQLTERVNYSILRIVRSNQAQFASPPTILQNLQ